MERKKVVLNPKDWELLTAGETVIIGNTPVDIIPFTFDELTVVGRRVAALTKGFKDEELSLKTLWEEENLEKFLNLVVTHAPDIISMGSGIDVEDLRKLPGRIVFDLAAVIFQVNAVSQRGLEKNLLDSVRKVTQGIRSLSGTMGTSRGSSSEKVSPLPKSEEAPSEKSESLSEPSPVKNEKTLNQDKSLSG